MKPLTYQEAYDKIIDAYFKNKIRLMDANFCFCGTLANGGGWTCFKKKYFNSQIHNYTYGEYGRMERALFLSIGREWEDNGVVNGKTHTYTENEIFTGMCAALEVLKEIHRERGEDVDTFVPARKFEKRELAK